MEDVPDQDSGTNQEQTQFKVYFAYTSKPGKHIRPPSKETREAFIHGLNMHDELSDILRTDVSSCFRPSRHRAVHRGPVALAALVVEKVGSLGRK